MELRLGEALRQRMQEQAELKWVELGVSDSDRGSLKVKLLGDSVWQGDGSLNFAAPSIHGNGAGLLYVWLFRMLHGWGG